MQYQVLAENCRLLVYKHWHPCELLRTQIQFRFTWGESCFWGIHMTYVYVLSLSSFGFSRVGQLEEIPRNKRNCSSNPNGWAVDHKYTVIWKTIRHMRDSQADPPFEVDNFLNASLEEVLLLQTGALCKLCSKSKGFCTWCTHSNS